MIMFCLISLHLYLYSKLLVWLEDVRHLIIACLLKGRRLCFCLRLCVCVCVPVNKISQEPAHCFECALQGIVITRTGALY